MKKCLVILLFFVTFSANAAISIGYRNIERIGCHNVDSTCFVYIDTAVGPSACSATSIRWNRATDPNGEATYALLLMAFASDKPVHLVLSDQCYGGQSGYPTIHYVEVK